VIGSGGIHLPFPTFQMELGTSGPAACRSGSYRENPAPIRSITAPNSAHHPIRGYAMSRDDRGNFRCIHKPRTMPRPLLSVGNVAASPRLHYCADREMRLPEGCGVDGDGGDGPVVLMTDNVFGGAVLIRRSPRRR
jgi:hypothetical protein